MSKNNKAKRISKKREALKRKKSKLNGRVERKQIDSSGFSTPVIKAFSPFKEISDEIRKELIDEIGKQSKISYQDNLKEIQQKIGEYDPITILAIVSGYGLTVGAGDKGVQYTERQDGFNQSHVEILQALILKIPENEWGGLLPTSDIIQDIINSLKDISQAFGLSKFSSDVLELNNKEKAINEVQDWIRNHTQSVRNWGFYSQVKCISTELYGYFDDELLNHNGFKASEVINVFDFMVRTVEQRLTHRYTILRNLKSINNKKELISRYHQVIGEDQNEANAFYRVEGISSLSVKKLFFLILSHYDLMLTDCFYFDGNFISEACDIPLINTINLLNFFSYSPGALSEKLTEHLFLDNPIWNKPIVRMRELYFCPAPQLFFSFVIPSFDELFESINKENLHNRRSKYLEEKIVEIVNRRFPESLAVSGITWRLGSEQYETDLIAVIDSHLVIIEAKSQKISKPALRGAPDRIKRHIKELFVEPSIQSSRLENRLNQLRLNPDINDELREKLPVDLNGIYKIIRLSVTLEDFATIQSSFSKFEDTDWLPKDFCSCPTMNLADFETLFDFLEHPVQIIHYLQRRTEIEGTINFVGCELDFMGLYASTLFNLGDINSEKFTHMIISEMSVPLDKYYASKDNGILIDKPKPRVSNLFNKILTQIESRSMPRWTEIGVLLNRFSPEDQIRVLSAIKVLKQGVRRNWDKEGHKNSIVLIPPDASEYALVVILYNDNNVQRKHEYIKNGSAMGLEPEHVNYCLVIAKNIDHDELPYHYISIVGKRK